MKKYLLILGGVLCALSAYAQEVITLPSSFDEHKIITKRRDEQGRYQPIYDDADPSTAEVVKEDPPAQEHAEPPAPPRRIKRYRAVEKDYSMPKSTFSSSGFSNMNDAPSSFSNSSMSETIKRFKKESTRFEECQEGEEGCRQYDVDDKGNVIW